MKAWQRYALLFIGFWLITVVLYRHGYGSQFIDDYLSWVKNVELKGWHMHLYKGHSTYYVNNSLFIGFYQVFGNSVAAWFLLFTGLHSLNATLAGAFLYRLFRNNGFKHALFGALSIALLFLVSPYQTENVIWGGTLYYQTCLAFMWGALLLYSQYLLTHKTWLLWAFYGSFVLALFSLGFALVFPGIYIVVFCLLWNPNSGWGEKLSHALLIGIPCVILLALYFGLNYWVMGAFIGHYGSETHASFHPMELLTNFWKYLFKLLFLVHFQEHEYREKIYNYIAQPWFLALCSGGLASIWLILWFIRRKLATFYLGWLLLIALMLLPVLNRYFMILNVGENDRFSYLASAFIYGLPVIIIMWMGWWIVRLIIPAALAIQIFYLKQQVYKWNQAATIQELAADSELFYTTGDVYLLNLPAYYQGIYIYRSMEYWQWYRKYIKGLPEWPENVRYVLSTNMNSITDSVIVTPGELPNTFKIELSAWGIWFLFKDQGAYDRDNDYLSVDTDDWNHSYLLHLPELKAEDKLLYFSPTGWREVERP